MIGELANNNGAMRPFVQTFVLASQSAKKYYVHNDIFRYQDDVYHGNGPTATTDAAAASFTVQQNHVDAAFDDAASGVFQCFPCLLSDAEILRSENYLFGLSPFPKCIIIMCLSKHLNTYSMLCKFAYV